MAKRKYTVEDLEDVLEWTKNIMGCCVLGIRQWDDAKDLACTLIKSSTVHNKLKAALKRIDKLEREIKKLNKSNQYKGNSK